MKAKFVAPLSLLVGGIAGYSTPPSFVRPNYPPNPQIAVIAQQFRQKNFTEVFERQNWWRKWHKAYMYSHAVSAQPQCGFIDPHTEITELYYSIPQEYQTSFDKVYPAILDEGLGSVAFRALPNRVGVTGTLEITVHQPTLNNSELKESRVLVLRALKPQGTGRKSVCDGELRWLNSDEVVAKGRVVMIEPWWGKYLAMVM